MRSPILAFLGLLNSWYFPVWEFYLFLIVLSCPLRFLEDRLDVNTRGVSRISAFQIGKTKDKKNMEAIAKKSQQMERCF